MYCKRISFPLSPAVFQIDATKIAVFRLYIDIALYSLFYLDSFCLTLLADCPVSYFVQSHIDRSVAYLTPSNVRLCESTAAHDRSRCESPDHHVWIVFLSLSIERNEKNKLLLLL